MAARKIKEHWYFWIIVNFTSAFLYFYKDLGLTGALYIIYGVLSVYGYFRWQKSYLAQQKTA
jgi:nicotinamide mononucleotide transporter